MCPSVKFLHRNLCRYSYQPGSAPKLDTSLTFCEYVCGMGPLYVSQACRTRRLTFVLSLSCRCLVVVLLWCESTIRAIPIRWPTVGLPLAVLCLCSVAHSIYAVWYIIKTLATFHPRVEYCVPDGGIILHTGYI